MIEYEIFYRRPAPLARHFEVLTEFLVNEFKNYDRNYKGEFYDVALIPSSISQPIEKDLESSIRKILRWHWSKEIPLEEVFQRYDISKEEAVRIVKEKSDPFGAIHFDITTPFGPNEIGNKVYDDRGLFEMNLLQSRVVIPHFKQSKELEMIKILEERLYYK